MTRMTRMTADGRCDQNNTPPSGRPRRAKMTEMTRMTADESYCQNATPLRPMTEMTEMTRMTSCTACIPTQPKSRGDRRMPKVTGGRSDYARDLLRKFRTPEKPVIPVHSCHSRHSRAGACSMNFRALEKPVIPVILVIPVIPEPERVP